MENDGPTCGLCAGTLSVRRDGSGKAIHAPEDVTMVTADCPYCGIEGRITWRDATLNQPYD